MNALLKSIRSFLFERWDNFVRNRRNKTLSKGDHYQLHRWIDKNRFVRGTNLRDKEVYEAGMQKDWHKIFDDWKLTPSQYEAVLISCRGHLPWAPMQYYRSHHY